MLAFAGCGILVIGGDSHIPEEALQFQIEAMVLPPVSAAVTSSERSRGANR